MRGSATGYEVAMAPDRDVRRELASTIVGRGWGLLELRPMRMSLEEIFLSLTTEETNSPPPGEAATGETASAEAVNE
jgi:ABC-2 type transport system ATP-binding protein